MSSNPLGKSTSYVSNYDSSLLFPIARNEGRIKNHINATSFVGYDIWNCHEFSFLDELGAPIVARLRIIYPANSIYIVESKSLKLYLGSYIMTKFATLEDARARVEEDLTALIGSNELHVQAITYHEKDLCVEVAAEELIDSIETVCNEYQVNPQLLQVVEEKEVVEKKFVSHLLASHCPITGQPDWASVEIAWKGRWGLVPSSLKRYFVSFREHADYHETCAERIFSDLKTVLQPEFLVVKCFFTRRGGIDINPCRFFGLEPDGVFNQRFWRQ